MNNHEITLNIPYFDLENNLANETLRCQSEKQTNVFTLIEPPLYAPNLAVGDKILASQEKTEWTWDELLETSGNSTIQIIELMEGSIENLLDILEEKQFLDTVRYANPEYISLNIPKQFPYSEIQNILLDWEQQGKISFREACLGFQAA